MPFASASLPSIPTGSSRNTRSCCAPTESRPSKVTGTGQSGRRNGLRRTGSNTRRPSCQKRSSIRDFAAALNAGRVDLLDHPRLRAQLVALERRVVRSGREVINAPWGSRDDLSNAVAGVITKVGGGSPKSMIDVLGDDTPEERYKWRFYQAFPFLRGVT